MMRNVQLRCFSCIDAEHLHKLPYAGGLLRRHETIQRGLSARIQQGLLTSEPDSNALFVPDRWISQLLHSSNDCVKNLR